MKLRNINPIGLVDVPLLYRQGEPFDTEGVGCLQPGEVFDVTEEQARQLLDQPGNYEPADDEATALLDELAAEARAAAELEIRRLTALANVAALEAASAARAAAEAAATPAATPNEGTA